MGTNAFNGSQKAAILLLSLGEEISSEIFKNLNEFELKRVGTSMSRLGRLEEDIIEEIILEFWEVLKQNNQFYYGDVDFTKKVIGSAFKGSEAEEIYDQLALSSSNLDSLDLIDARTLGGFLRGEHPQTIALILAHLDPIRFGETLKMLPESMHIEIILRVANLDAVAPELIDEIEDILRQEVQAIGSIDSSKIGGVDALANMFNLLDKATEEEMLDNLEERDPELVEAVRQLMFTFDDLVQLDEKSAQELIKAVPNDKWKIALKTATEGVKELIFANMSTRASEMLREDIESMGAMKLSEVEAIQFEIINITRKLEDEGKVVLAGDDGDYV